MAKITPKPGVILERDGPLLTADADGNVIGWNFVPSSEEMCRNLLAQAIADGLVAPAPGVDGRTTAGDLCGVANLLSEYLRNERLSPSPPLNSRSPNVAMQAALTSRDTIAPCRIFSDGVWHEAMPVPAGMTAAAARHRLATWGTLAEQIRRLAELTVTPAPAPPGD